MRGWIGAPQDTPCSYFPEKTSRMETALLEGVEPPLLGALLERGVRHFAEEFFRPACRACGMCLPLRIPVGRHKPSRSERRVLSKGRRFTASLEQPEPSREAWQLYKVHKRRFPDGAGEREDYDQFRKIFFTPTPGHRVWTIRDRGTLITAAHLDIFPSGISAVYTYYHDDYPSFSLGTLAVLQQIQLARELGKQHLYLGYWIPCHRHMDYKKKFLPNQLLLEPDTWYDYRNSRGEIVLNPEVPLRYVPSTPLEGYFARSEECP